MRGVSATLFGSDFDARSSEAKRVSSEQCNDEDQSRSGYHRFQLTHSNSKLSFVDAALKISAGSRVCYARIFAGKVSKQTFGHTRCGRSPVLQSGLFREELLKTCLRSDEAFPSSVLLLELASVSWLALAGLKATLLTQVSVSPFFSAPISSSDHQQQGLRARASRLVT